MCLCFDVTHSLARSLVRSPVRSLTIEHSFSVHQTAYFSSCKQFAPMQSHYWITFHFSFELTKFHSQTSARIHFVFYFSVDNLFFVIKKTDRSINLIPFKFQTSQFYSTLLSISNENYIIKLEQMNWLQKLPSLFILFFNKIQDNFQ